MVKIYNKSIISQRTVKGSGLINSLINKLPIELHLPGYQFCGPGTKLEKRLARGDRGINELDAACREHDIAYSQYKDIDSRHKADKILANKAWNRVKSADSSISERTNAWLVTNAMKTKRKFGMGLNNFENIKKVQKPKKKVESIINKKKKKRKKSMCGKVLFKSAITNAKKMLTKFKPENIENAIKIADKAVKVSIKNRKLKPIIPRVIPIPKVGGFLPLIPIMSALSAVGGLATGGSAIVKAINAAKAAREQFNEQQRHNKKMESIAIDGKGIYLKPYKTGYGLYYNPNQQQQQTSKNF